jgi:DNA-binding LytR/AlgR family response regulator
MNKLDVLIIEDEAVAADRLEEVLNKVDSNLQIVGKIGSVQASVQWLMQHQADLIFMDIQLSDGLCFSIFDQLSITTPIIFTTAYDEYAIKAFQLNSISYLLKPIREADVKESLDKYDRMKGEFETDINQLLRSIRGDKPEYKRRFLVRIGDIYKKIDTQQLAYFYAMDKHVFAQTFEGKKLPIDQSLDTLERILDPDHFFRINRGYVINSEAIASMEAWSRGRIRLELTPPHGSTDAVVVSISRSPEFKQWLDK